ncbi:pyrroloquinoline quinone biosynthesis peptide chaperone PqqD [Nitrincola tibetensis]|uniref:PqqA binding protein n=1 Tax=Nitrincola tibetensis TaxID=2219697 RepID=A0A364NPJ8_9GAMM|nr:pyrroloquinoline quinone biosynthesis peptide chaperone PqqD [Nitrincola tibetensis]RAU19028.1 pyrroloquinoline quinone biosynthesis peptide chaperone PqqD [Nitrincola tibetensis]
MNAAVPAINRMFRLQWEEAQDAWVLLYPEGMVQLNASAAEILTRVDGKKTITEIQTELLTKYPEAEGLEQDVNDFFVHAQTLNWIRYV